MRTDSFVRSSFLTVLAVAAAFAAKPALTSGSTTSASSLDPKIQAAIEFRDRMGLDSGVAHVTSVAGHPSAVYFWEVPLLPEESDMLLERSNRAAEVVPALRAIGEATPGWAGLYMDNSAPPSLVVLTSDDTNLMQTRVGGVETHGIPVRVNAVAHSWAELEELRATVRSESDAWIANDVVLTEIGIDVVNNQVRVGIEVWSDQAAQDLRRSYGDALAVVERPRATPLCISRTDCGSPIKGGLEILDWYSSACSAGFVARDTAWAGAAYLMTAGHCISPAGFQPWRHNGSSFGTASSNFYYGTSDADVGYVTLATLASPGNHLFAANASDVRPMVGWYGNAAQYVGQNACKSGRTTGYTCGSIYYINFSIYQPGGFWIDRQSLITLNALNGDSGAPILSINQGLGILSSGTPYNIWYSPLGWIQSQSGKQICTTSSC